jgi:hypothetical protein
METNTAERRNRGGSWGFLPSSGIADSRGAAASRLFNRTTLDPLPGLPASNQA